MGKYNPIGIFDSGVGGLTVVKSLMQELPQESFIYFGDTANVPYGSKTEDQLFAYAYNIVDFFINHRVKAIIAACGTHSSVTLPKMKKEYSLPFLGVVEPGAYVAANFTQNDKIGVIATKATVASLAYTKAINDIKVACKVFEVACPKFVPLVEEGNLAGIETKNAVKEYIGPLLDKGIDALILGCTHYPFLTEVIKDYVGADIGVIDPSLATIENLKDILAKKDLLNESNDNPEYDFYVSGDDDSFYNVGNLLLENVISEVYKVNLE